eukprot:1157693-Pelagomonas_calceolata.AAC.2
MPVSCMHLTPSGALRTPHSCPHAALLLAPYLPTEDAKASTSKAGAAAPGAAEEQPAQPTFLAFAGSGRRLDGKAATPSQPVPVPKPGAPPGVQLLTVVHSGS